MQLPSLRDLDDIRRTGFRPQVVGCFLNNKKILFLFKEEHNLWQLPQGGIDNQEDVNEAVMREMTEELGKKFTNEIKSYSLVGEDQLEFPGQHKGSREIKTDEGEEIFMEGKKFFFLAIDVNITDLSIDETEFNDYRWLNYKEALELSNKIYQKEKKRITVGVLEKLHGMKLL
jgi:putative (di)nucleoside polyphosphate hydrolase